MKAQLNIIASSAFRQHAASFESDTIKNEATHRALEIQAQQENF
jgi:hypothetical protein